MKILMITPYLPYPLFSGGQIRSYNLLKNLAKKHDITLFSFMKQINKDHVSQLKNFCKKIEVFKRRKAWSPQNVLFSGFSFYPFLVAIYFSPSLKARIKEELEKEKYDLIHAETFYVMPNIPQTEVPILLVEQTIEYLVYDHFIQTIKFPLARAPLLLDVLKLKFWETFYWKKAKMVGAMSQADKKEMRGLVPNLKVEIIPNGVDVDYFAKAKGGEILNTILFVGNFSWLQNKEAVYFLVREIWPKIKKKVKDAKLWIVGRNPNDKIRKLEKDGEVRIDEDIEDIREAYLKSSVLLAPIFGPGGTRFKILEAMASGLPVVTTPTGIEGLPAQNNTHLLMGESGQELANATVKVLKEKELSLRLSNNAKKLVGEEFSWQKISAKLDNIYQNLSYGKD
jgi:glycosyltransferase involved in cell wall biosynthesis